ncbi:G-type lectin S-receptor-like serine/threonine-protein kinase At1g34300 [Chenopodium quinoa]|nr:G-type lectin S-receptor-like serine/threonine-protein kinase At1g34300 [Chenopodium quinoa]
MNIRNFLIFYPLFFIPLLSSSSVFAADILPGSSLYASSKNQKWSSPRNTFSLLFLPMTPTTFSLCIAYGGSVSIWEPAGKTDGNSSFHFLSDGNLRLINGYGEFLWQSNTTHLGVTHATLEDSGNFVLKNGSVSLWHSFEHLTDTLVPSQNFTVSDALTSGLYTFSLDRSGNLTLKWNNNILYWNYGVKCINTVISNLTNPSLAIRQNGILSLYDPNLSNPVNMAYSSDFDDGNEFRFFKLDSDGNLRTYSVSNGITTVKWTGISDQCEVFGYCGNMGICTYNVTGNPTCSCPSKNFLFVDPTDSRKGCKRKVEIKDCPGTETVLPMNHTRFLTYPPESSAEQFILGTTACRLNCLSGSGCVASTVMADGTGYCYIKTSGFVSGYQSPTIPGSSFVKVCGPIEPNLPMILEGSGNSTSWKLHSWIIVVLASLGTLVGLFILGGVIWWTYFRNNPKLGGFSPHYALLEYASGTPVPLSYKDLRRVTKGFKEKLGAGGFGAVYKGSLYNMAVAVKQLEGIEQGEKQFRMEVATISSTHHLNLVRLIGFCSEGGHRLLVYEFMKNGSLDKFLFVGENQSFNLNWEQRFNIAVGTARGITYLHEECRDCIVHCDIKPENILLDDILNAIVSDFGLAKLINQKEQQTRKLTTFRGTRGYLGPEWLANLPITSKSDVYSFGMVLLEIVSGRRNFEVSVDTNMTKFSIWAYEELEKGNIMNIVDKRLGEEFDVEQARRALLVGFWCIQHQPSQRPVMGKVVQMLEGVIPVENPPPLKTNEED